MRMEFAKNAVDVDENQDKASKDSEFESALEFQLKSHLISTPSHDSSHNWVENVQRDEIYVFPSHPGQVSYLRCD